MPRQRVTVPYPPEVIAEIDKIASQGKRTAFLVGLAKREIKLDRQKGRTLSLPDLTVAAVAITNGLRLATDNAKDFPMSELRLYPLP